MTPGRVSRRRARAHNLQGWDTRKAAWWWSPTGWRMQRNRHTTTCAGDMLTDVKAITIAIPEDLDARAAAEANGAASPSRP